MATNKDSTSNEAKKKSNEVSSVNHKFEYLLTEVSIFNNRLVWYLEQQQKQEIFALAASGALWAYLLKENINFFNILVAFVPPLITAALYAKSIVMTKAMDESMKYLEKLETSFELGIDFGWIHFYKRNTSNYKRKWRTWFWRVLLLINLLMSTTLLLSNSSNSIKNSDNENIIPETKPDKVEKEKIIKDDTMKSMQKKLYHNKE